MLEGGAEVLAEFWRGIAPVFCALELRFPFHLQVVLYGKGAEHLTRSEARDLLFQGAGDGTIQG